VNGNTPRIVLSRYLRSLVSRTLAQIRLREAKLSNADAKGVAKDATDDAIGVMPSCVANHNLKVSHACGLNAAAEASNHTKQCVCHARQERFHARLKEAAGIRCDPYIGTHLSSFSSSHELWICSTSYNFSAGKVGVVCPMLLLAYPCDADLYGL